MSVDLPALDTFTVILIGGTAQLAGGGDIDTRREYLTDPLCNVPHRVAANSLLWWEAATSLVIPMIDSTDHLSQASIFGQRTLAEVSPVGETKRKRLMSVLEGTVAAVKDETVAKAFKDAAWLLSTYDLHNKRRLNDDLKCQLFVSTDASLFTASWANQPLFRAFERFVEPGSVLIVPHTRLVERFLNAYSEWVNLAREPNITDFLVEEDAVDLAKAAPPSTSSATFEVTGLFAANSWQNPRPLEAARRLKQERFDLDIGLWDLVNDEPLRQALLEEEPLDAASTEPIDLPAAYLAAAQSQLDEKERLSEQRADQRRSDLDEVTKMLAEDGWVEYDQRPDAFTYTLAEGIDADGSVMDFNLYINKGSAAAYLESGNRELRSTLRECVADANDALAKAYESSDFEESADSSAIWRIRKVGSLIDIAQRAIELRPRWETILHEAITIGQQLETQADAEATAVAQRAEILEPTLTRMLGTDLETKEIAFNGLRDRSADVRARTIELLVELGTHEIALFERYAIEDPDDRVRGAALHRLTTDEVSIERSVPTLLHVVQNDPNDYNRATAAGNYFRKLPNEFHPVVAAALTDTSSRVVRAALDTIAWSKATDDFRADIEGLTGHDNAEVRESAAYALGRSDSGDSTEILKQLAADESSDVRAAALESLAEIAKTKRIASTDAASGRTPVLKFGVDGDTRKLRVTSPAVTKLSDLVESYRTSMDTMSSAAEQTGKIDTPAKATAISNLLTAGLVQLRAQQQELETLTAEIRSEPSSNLQETLLASCQKLETTIAGGIDNVEEQLTKIDTNLSAGTSSLPTPRPPAPRPTPATPVPTTQPPPPKPPNQPPPPRSTPGPPPPAPTPRRRTLRDLFGKPDTPPPP